MGLSFGGYLAPRAAAKEHRIHALVASPAVVDWGASTLRHLNKIPGLMSLHQSPGMFNSLVATIAAAWPDAGWYFEDCTHKHGVDNPAALIDELKTFKYGGDVAVGDIQCRTLIMEGEGEDVSPGQSRKFYDLLQSPKHMIVFDVASAAQTHCQGGGNILARARLMDWLDDNM